MRLIDADQMAVDESEAYMSAQVQITDDLKWLVNFAAHSKIQKLIADTPTVDAVPVVRCKECAEFQQKGKYYNGTPFGYCYHWDYEEGSSPNKVDGNDFCSYGKRREDA